MPALLTSVPPWTGHPLCLYLCILRRSSQALLLFLHGQTFPGIFAVSCLHTWRNCESLSWVMCVYPPQATEVTPSRHWQRGQQLRVAISKVARLGEWPHCLCCLSAIWPRSGWRRVGWGYLLARPCYVFRSTEFWQHRSIWCRKMPSANESQQCLSNWTTTRKALCNWDTVNISKLSLNKLSVFIFSTLYLIFFETACNWRHCSECRLRFVTNQRHFVWNYFSISLKNGRLAKRILRGQQSGKVVGWAVGKCKDFILRDKQLLGLVALGQHSSVFFRMCNLNVIADKIKMLPYQRCAKAAAGECSSFTHVLIVVCFGLSSVPHLQHVLVKYLSCSERRGYIKMGMWYDDLMGTPEGLLVCQRSAVLVVFSPRSHNQRAV